MVADHGINAGTYSGGLRLAYGLCVAGDAPLAGAVPWPHGAMPADVRLSIMPPVALPPTGTPVYRHTDEGIRFTARGVATYDIAANGISVAPHRQGNGDTPVDADGDVAALLAATALPALLWMRGGLVLHAAGVCLPGNDGVIAIAGASGSGKTTVAMTLVDRGARLAGDDSVWLTQTGEGVIAAGLAGAVQSRVGDKRRFVALDPDRTALQPMPLAGVIVIDPAMDDGVTRPLHGVAAVTAILGHVHRPAVPALLGRHGDVIGFVTGIVRSVPVCLAGRDAVAACAERMAMARAMADEPDDLEALK